MRLSILTPAEARFAAEHHQLVFSFLDRNCLDERDYYDVAIFGYLSAVQRYLQSKNLQRYRFSTIAWLSMTGSVSKEIRTELARRRTVPVVSLDFTSCEAEQHAIETWLSVPCDVFVTFEMRLLLDELSQLVTEKQMEIIHMRIRGYSNNMIAKALRIPPRTVSAALAELYDVVMDVCYG